MQNPFKTKKIKRANAIVIAAILIANSFVLSIGGISRMSSHAADEEASVPAQAVSISQAKAEEIMNFLKKLDTNSGRSAFDSYTGSLTRQKEELISLKESLIFHVSHLSKIQDYLPPMVGIGFEDLHDSAEYADLGQLRNIIIEHIKYGQLITEDLQYLKNLVSTLESNQILNNVDYLEARFNSENELIKLLEEKGGGAYDSLISELLLQNKITEFFISYAMAGRTLLDQIKSVINEDASFITELMTKESSILDIYDRLYTDSDYNIQLKGASYDLFRMMSNFSADNFENIKSNAENIFNALNAVSVSPVLPEESKYINEMIAELKNGITDSFSKKAAEFSGYLKSNDLFIKLIQDDISTLYGIPIQFKSLIGYTNHPAYKDAVIYLMGIYQLIPDYESELKVLLKQKQTEESVQSAETDVKENVSSGQEEITDVEQQPADIEIPSPVTDENPVTEDADIQLEENDNQTDISVNQVDAEPEVQVTTDETSVEAVTEPQVISDNEITVDTDSADIPSSADAEIETQPIIQESGTDQTHSAAPENISAETETDVNQPVTTEEVVEPITEIPQDQIPAQDNTVDQDIQPSDETQEPESVPETVTENNIPESGGEDLTDKISDSIQEQDVGVAGEGQVPSEAVSQEPQISQDEPQSEIPEITPDEIINILEGNISVEEAFDITKAENNPYVQSIDNAIRNIEFAEKYSVMTKGLLDNLKPSDKTERYISELNSLGLSTDEYDELLSFLNQVIIKLGLSDATSMFSGKNGVLRFGSQCDSFLKWSALKPYDENEEMLTYGKEDALKASSREQSMEADQDYLNLKQERKLNADFCVEESEDITTKNLIGLKDASKQITDNYIIDQERLHVDFFNNSGQNKTISLEGRKQFTIMHADPNSVQNANIDDAVNDAVNTALQDKLGKNVVIENVDISLQDIEPVSYIMSALEDPGLLYTPLGKKQIRYDLIYESSDHRKNYVNVYADEADSVNSRSMSEYTIFNYGDGHEDENLLFENTVLRMSANGAVEGYIVDDSILNQQNVQIVNADETHAEDISVNPIDDIILNGRVGGPDFIISTPFGINMYGSLIKDFSYEITGDMHNEIRFSLNINQDEYPAAMKSRITFVSQGQSSYDVYADSYSATSGNFAASQVTGDFNGDGILDIAAGSYSSGGYDGSVSVYLMKKDNPHSLVPDAVITGESSYGIGFSLAAADINGDGKDELMTGSPFYENNTGRVWIFDGKSLSENTNSSVVSLGSAEAIIDGAGSDDRFGYSMVTGDFDSDGKTDIAVSAPNDRVDSGAVHMFFNNSIINASVDADNLSVIKPISASQSDIIIAGESTIVENFGNKLMTGDFDNDGKTDILISAPVSHADSGKSKVYMFYQNENPWTSSDDKCAKNCSASKADVSFTGEEGFGKSLASGDFNNDKKTDIAIGNPDFDAGTDTDEGIVYIFHQDGEIWSSGEGGCVLCGSDDADVKISGNTGERFGFSIIATDINADATADLVVGSIHSGFDRGNVATYLNNPSSDIPNISMKGFLSSDDSYYVMTGDNLSYFGYSLVSGDFNQDGISDISAGAPYFDDYRGKLYVFYGKGKYISEEEQETDRHKPQIPEEEQKQEDKTDLTDAISSSESDTNITPENFELTPEIIDNALKESAPSAQDYLIDFSVPEKPVITCEGFTDGIYSEQSYAKCRWTDTAGPSKGVYKYCIDIENSCAPDMENQNMYVELINLSSHHNYLRVQTSDEGGVSEISSFDIAVDNMTKIISGPSDNSDKDHPVKEGEAVTFSVTSKDPEGDPYYLLICRTNDIPVYTDDKPACLGASNSFCTSDLTQSGNTASCVYKTKEEPGDSSIWYAFVCEKDGIKKCSEPFQGTGQNGSPFYVSHPSKFSNVSITNINGGPVMPGDLLKITVLSQNITDVPDGSFVTMYACSENTSGFDYVESKCLGGNLICSSQPSDPRSGDVTCSEVAGDKQEVPAPSAAAERHIHVFMKHGERGLIQGVPLHRFIVGNSEPSVIDYINQGIINIPGGGNTKVAFSAIIQDLNGAHDIESVSGVFFDSGTVWNDCTKSNNDCYKADKCALTRIDEKTVKADCIVTVYYNANAGDDWKVHVNVFDGTNTFTDLTDSANSRTVPPLVAINQEEITVPYNITEPGQVSGPVETLLSNLGNVTVDVLISGTDLTGDSYLLPRELQKWSTDKNFDYDKQGYSLVDNAKDGGSPVDGCADITLSVHNDTDKKEVPIYWKIRVPENQKADIYQGSVYFNPIPDSCTAEAKSSVQDIINR